MRPERRHLLLKRLLEDFHPMWFVMTMGTGISSNVLYTFPYPSHWLRICSYIMFAVCCFIFLLLNFIFFATCYYFPRRIPQMFLNTTESAFWGCYSMGFSSIISYLHVITSGGWITTLFVLWIINVAISIGTSCIITFLIHYRSSMQPQDIHLLLLLPVVSQNVVASIGGVLYSSIHPNLRLFLVMASYLCWANGMALSGWVVGVYFWKLYVHSIARGFNSGFASFIAVGAFGQGAYGILLITNNFRDYLLRRNPDFLNFGNEGIIIPNNNIIVGESVKFLGLFTSLFLVSNAFFFTFTAILTLCATKVNGFTRTWWSCTFPLGTVALATREMYILFGFGVFRVVSVIYSSVLVLITTTCIFGTLVYEFPHEIYRPLKPSTTSDTTVPISIPDNSYTAGVTPVDSCEKGIANYSDQNTS